MSPGTNPHPRMRSSVLQPTHPRHEAVLPGARAANEVGAEVALRVRGGRFRLVRDRGSSLDHRGRGAAGPCKSSTPASLRGRATYAGPGAFSSELPLRIATAKVGSTVSPVTALIPLSADLSKRLASGQRLAVDAWYQRSMRSRPPNR